MLMCVVPKLMFPESKCKAVLFESLDTCVLPHGSTADCHSLVRVAQQLWLSFGLSPEQLA